MDLPCMETAQQDFIEAWKEAVYDHWETVQQIRRGECRSDRFMEFHILLSDATRTWLINIGELRRVAPGHWHLYADIDTKLRDERRRSDLQSALGAERGTSLLGVLPSASSDQRWRESLSAGTGIAEFFQRNADRGFGAVAPEGTAGQP